MHTQLQLQRVPYLRVFHYRGSHYRDFWLMYAQVGDFRIGSGPPTVPITQILRNAVFFKSQNPRKRGPSVFHSKFEVVILSENSYHFVSSL